MASPGSNEAVAAAFAFGVVATATLGTAVLYFRGGTSSLRRDGPRLVLVLYLAFSFLWALTDFVAMLVDTGATVGCQLAVAFASAFDQLARLLLEQFLFWGMKSEVRASVGVLFPQAVMVLRFVLGGIYVAVQRPQFKPACVGTTLVLPLGIAVVATDAFIVLVLLVRASSIGTFRDVSAKAPGWPRSRGLLYITLGLVLWIALSVPMTLGMGSFDLTVRTVLPAVGLFIVIVLAALFSNSLITKYDVQPPRWPPTPDAPPPAFPASKDAPTRDISTRDLQSRDISTIDTSYPPKPYTGGRAPPTSNEPLQESPQDISPSGERGGLPIIRGPSPGQAQAGVGGLPIQGQLFPPMRAQTELVAPRRFDKQPIKKATVKSGKLVISSPIVTAESENGPLRKITTVDLATAAMNEKERRVMYSQPPKPSLTESSKSMSPKEIQNKPQDLKRKEVGSPVTSNAESRTLLQSIVERSSVAASSSAQLSPRRDDLRRRSPRQISQDMRPESPPAVPLKDVEAPEISVFRTSTATIPLVPPPRSPLRPAPKAPASGGSWQQGASSSTSPRRPPSSKMAFRDPNSAPKMPAPFPVAPKAVEPPKPASPRQSVEVLVPPVPPLSPRERPPTFYKSSGSLRQTREPFPALPRNRSVRADIRPSRQTAEPAVPEDQNKPAPAKTPVQLRQNNGIPSNPRARIAKALPKPKDGPDEQTVKSVTGIAQHAPGNVKSGSDQVLGNTVKEPPNSNELSRVKSVVHRPRPIPRKSVVESSPLSAVSIVSLTMQRQNGKTPAEPTELKRSILPQSAGILQPTTYLQTGAGSSQPQLLSTDASHNLKRRSSLPDISLASASPRPTTQDLPIVLVREVTKASLTEEILKLGNYAPGSRPRQSRFVSKFSVDTSMSPLEEPQSGLYESPVDNRSSNEGVRRRSSPVLPAEEVQDSPVSENAEPQSIEFGNDAKPDQVGATLSPESTSNIQDPISTEAPAVPFKSPMWPNRSTYRFVDSAMLTDDDDGKETMTVMLDQSAEQLKKADEIPAQEPQQALWHRRVGDDCPSFSDRKGTAMLRNVPRPPPLQLNKPGKTRKVVAAEPLSLESPRQALDMIKEQLKNFEEPKEETIANDQQRMTLLANLEMEMGLQENHWQQMRQDYARASVATSVSSPIVHSANASPELSPTIKNGPVTSGSAASNGRSSRLEPRDERESGFYSPYSAVTATASQVQMSRLKTTEAPPVNDAENMLEESVPGPGLTVDERTMSQPNGGSLPQVSASEEQGNIHGQSDPGNDPNVHNSVDNGNPTSTGDIPAPSSPGPLLKPTIDAATRPEIVEHPAATASPEISGLSEPLLEIESLELGSESRTPTNTRPKSALLQKTPRPPTLPEGLPPQRALLTRSRTQRPPRVSKRISTLPDIVEDPVPLLNKRGTLGIFQFPSGEKSDTVTIQRPNQIRMGLGMATMSVPVDKVSRPQMYPGPGVQIRTMQPQGYPSSFFDEYEDEGDTLMDSSDEDEDEDDDSFDEETLWEIASLLRSDNIPSRESLLPGQRSSRLASSSMVEDYYPASPVPEAESEQAFETSPAPQDRGSSSPTLPAPDALWVDRNRYASMPKAGWLPQPDKGAWTAMIASISKTSRAAPRNSEVAPITSNTLWSETSQDTAQDSSHPTRPEGHQTAALWAPKSAQASQVKNLSLEESNAVSHSPRNAIAVNFMWSPHQASQTSPVGLAQPGPNDWTKYEVSGNTSSPVESQTAPVATIQSTSIWEPSNANQPEVAGVSEPKTQPETASKGEIDTPNSLWSLSEPFVGSSHDISESNTDVAMYAGAASETLQSDSLDSLTILQDTDEREVSFGLWVPSVIASQTEDVEGLFCVDHPRNDYKNTLSKAAALGTRPTRAIVKKPLPPIVSTSLWSSRARHTFAQDWVSLSSIRPSTPGGASSASESESPFSDASSVHSSVTGLSTVGSTFTACPDDSAPRQANLPGWDADSQGAARPSPPARDLLSAADWGAALEDAIRASGHVPVPSSGTPRAPASESDRGSVLTEPIQASGLYSATPEAQRDSTPAEPPQVEMFDVSSVHPVFAVSSLECSSADVHPAGKGYFIHL